MNCRMKTMSSAVTLRLPIAQIIPAFGLQCARGRKRNASRGGELFYVRSPAGTRALLRRRDYRRPKATAPDGHAVFWLARCLLATT